MTGVVDLSDAWAAAMWRASWQGGLAALVAWSVCRLVPSMPAWVQAWLWRLVVLKFAVALLWPVPIAVPLLPPSAPATVERDDRAAPDRSGMGGEPAVRRQPSGFVTPWRIAFLVWSVVVGWQAVRIVAACRAVHRLRIGCHLSENWELLDHLAAAARSVGLGSPPQLLEAEGEGSPMLIGFLRPAIVLPAATLSRLDDAERAMVLSHELAHLERGDLFWALIATLVRTAFVFHPLVWLTERRLRATQEIAADELAISRQNGGPLRYAMLLLSCVVKIGTGRSAPTMSVGAAGSHRSLEERLFAMRFMKPVSRPIVFTYALALGMAAALGVVPWAAVPARAADKGETKEAVDQKDKRGWGRFVSFKDGTLTLESNSGVLMVWHKIAETTKASRFDPDAKAYKPVAGTVEALNEVKAGTLVVVGAGKVDVRIGARAGKVSGTFVSFKEGRLLMLGKDLGESFTKKYGNNVHFNKFRDDVPVHESIDGGEYKPIGTANKVLGGVKDGTVLTVHSEGDDNITLIQIGAPKKK